MHDWDNFEKMMYKILPGHKIVRLDVSDPIFDSFFHIESLDFPHPWIPRLMGEFYGIYEDNDPNKTANGARQLQHGHRGLLGVVGYGLDTHRACRTKPTSWESTTSSTV